MDVKCHSMQCNSACVIQLTPAALNASRRKEYREWNAYSRASKPYLGVREPNMNGLEWVREVL